MAKPQKGDTVKVHYTGRLDDGTVFDSSANREPLEFEVGSGQIIPGFEQAVVGMDPGESATITIPAGDAYGPRRDEMVVAVGRDQFPSDAELEVGDQFHMQGQNGEAMIVTVVEVSAEDVTLDANHPLAGKDLTFDIDLVSVR